mgnify:CR=1 FL=1
MGTENTGGGEFVKLDAQNKNKKAGALNVTSNIHEALQNSGIADITEKLDNAAGGFDIGSNIIKDANIHDNTVVAAASIGSMFTEKLSALGSGIKSSIQNMPINLLKAGGKYFTDKMNQLPIAEQQKKYPLPMRMMLNALSITKGVNDRGDWTEKDLSALMKNKLAQSYYRAKKRMSKPDALPEDKLPRLDYSSYLVGDESKMSIEEKFNSPGYLLRYSLGHAAFKENEDGTVTFTDTHDYNDSKKFGAGKSWFKYKSDGSIDLGKNVRSVNEEGRVVTNRVYEGEEKALEGGKSIYDMTDAQKLSHAIDEIKAHGKWTDITTNMRVLAYYFGDKDSSGKNVNITIDPNMALIRENPISKEELNEIKEHNRHWDQIYDRDTPSHPDSPLWPLTESGITTPEGYKWNFDYPIVKTAGKILGALGR